MSQEVVETIKSVQDSCNNLALRLDEVQKANEDFRKNGPWGAPHIRRGENPLTSRGYSYLKALGVLAGQIDPNHAQVEVEYSNKLRKYFDGFGFKRGLVNSIFLPMGSAFIVGDEQLAQEVGQVTKAGMAPFDPSEIQFHLQKMAQMGYTKALSWTDALLGGSTVAPPAFGELIDLLRNNAVLMQAGARVIPMPPQGRIVWPRRTSASTAYHVGESVNLTASDVGTGDVTLQAKKLTTLSKIPNELFHFSALPIEAFVREDIAQVLMLKMDKTLLEDVGANTIPKGLINYSGITAHISTDSGTTTDGYRIQPADIHQMVAKCEEKNATFKAFVGRPLLYSTLVNRRADSVTAGDGKGPFLFDIVRSPSTDMGPQRLKVGNLSGYPFYKTTQVSNTRTRGSSVDLTYLLGGDFNDFIIAMGPAMEWSLSREGDTPFVADQTWFKSIMYYDGAVAREASFVWCDQLYQST